MVDVFISYSRDDKEKVAVLARMIASEGYEVWWDADLPPHMSYGDVITAKIGAAKAAVVVWSATAAKSEWVRAEADVARNQKKLIQTALDDTMPPLPFNQIQCAEIGDWDGEPDHRGWSKVKQSLVALCGPREAEAQGEIVSGPESPVATIDAPKPATKAAASSSAKPAPSFNPAAAPKKGMSAPLIIALGCGGLTIFAVIMLVVLAAIGASLEEPETFVADPGMEDIFEPQEPAPPPVSEPDGDFIPQLDGRMDQTPPVTDQPAIIEVFLVATVQDPDGYTNVRAGPSADTAIVGSVQVGDVFTTYQQNTLWWSVLLEDGTEGYIYNDRIFVIGPQ